MRGQISLEYLLLGLVTLSLLGISLATLQTIRQNADAAYAQQLFQQDSDRLADTIDRLCLLGPGNSWEVSLQEPLTIRYASDHAYFERDGYREERAVLCPIEDMELSGTVTLENKDNTIVQK